MEDIVTLETVSFAFWDTPTVSLVNCLIFESIRPMNYVEISTLIPAYDLEDFPTELDDDQAESILNCFAVMWHPSILANLSQIPTWRRAESEPEIFADRLVFVPTACQWTTENFAERVLAEGGSVIQGLQTREELLEAVSVVFGKKQPTSYKKAVPEPEYNDDHHDDYHDDGHETGYEEGYHHEYEEPVPQIVIKTLNEEGVPTEVDASTSIEEETPGNSKLSPELEKDFLALGFCYLQIELLSRQMHHFSSVDEISLRSAATKAARAALEGDEEAASTGLNRCFELLLDVREVFYPVECFLIDLCLLAPEIDAEAATNVCQQAYEGLFSTSEGSEEQVENQETEEYSQTEKTTEHPVNFLINGEELEQLNAAEPELCKTFLKTWSAEKIDFCGGEQVDRPLHLLPLGSVFWNFNAGQRTFKKILGQQPSMWARKRFGFTTLLPQMLNRHGYKSAYHFALDDGVYPDEEHTKLQWEGADGTTIDSSSRIPLAADSAGSFIKFPLRLSESMESDNVAGLILARYPNESGPWMEDLRRISAYAPVLGRFVTWTDFFQESDSYCKQANNPQKKYQSAVLSQRVAYELTNPIGQFIEHFQNRYKLQTAAWATALCGVLLNKTVANSELSLLETELENTGPKSDLLPPTVEEESTEDDLTDNEVEQELLSNRLEKQIEQSSIKLANLLTGKGGTENGSLLLNPLPHPRRTIVPWPSEVPLPEVNEVVRAVQDVGAQKMIVADLPACGFAWNATATSAPPALPELRYPAVEENVLRNEFFEVHINPVTGGIAKIKGFERSPVRLSQQVAYRMPREQKYMVERNGQEVEIRSSYSEPVCRRCDLTATGPVFSEITTETDLYDPVRSLKLARVKQITRVYRGCKFIDVKLELDVTQMPLADPWSNYYALRFAWHDATAAVTRSVQHAGFSFESERFESTEYIEIGTEGTQTTLLMPGLPFHRETSPRMFDTLLVSGKEQQREFEFRIAIDEPSPSHALANYTQAPVLVPNVSGPPSSAAQGWFFHFNTKNVQLLQILDAVEQDDNPVLYPAENPGDESQKNSTAYGFCLRVMETVGQVRSLKIQTFKEAAYVRQRNYLGQTMYELKATEDSVQVDLAPYEIAEIEIWFE